MSTEGSNAAGVGADGTGLEGWTMPWHTSAQRSGRAERLFNVDVTMDRSGEPDDIAPRTSTLRRSQGHADAALSVSELFRAHHLELVRLAVVMVGDLATAEDVVQDCFERLHRRWHVIREPGRALACYGAAGVAEFPGDYLTGMPSAARSGRGRGRRRIADQSARTTAYSEGQVIAP